MAFYTEAHGIGERCLRYVEIHPFDIAFAVGARIYARLAAAVYCYAYIGGAYDERTEKAQDLRGAIFF